MIVGNAEQLIKDIFDENFHSLVFSSFRITKDYAQAEDIVQNVFVKIWQNFEKIKDHQNLKSYIFKTVRNSSLNYLRDQKPNRKFSLSEEALNIETNDGHDSEMDKGDLLNRLHQAADNLPKHWREAFILSKYENLKYHEIAEKMNISNKTVEKYISKALKTLRLELKHLITILIVFFLHQV